MVRKANQNIYAKEPVISIRISRELDAQFKAICFEAGEIERSVAINRILQYLTQPQSIETTKSIIQNR